MKRYTRSHTLISPSLKITSKINLLKAKITNKKETDDTKIGNRIKTLINFNLNNNNQNPFRSGKKLFSGLNMTHPDYLAEYKTEKQKSDEQYEKNISNIAELLTSKFSRNDTREEMSLVYALKHREKRGFDIEKNGVQRIESGQRFVTDIELKFLSNVLAADVEYLLEHDDLSPSPDKEPETEQLRMDIE